MPVTNPSHRTDRLLVAAFFAALVVQAWLTTRNWHAGFLPGHEFRQTQTAITSYYIDLQDNFSLLYETPLMGKPWVSILMEVPVYEWSVVGLSRWLHIPHHVAARSISLACFYLMFPALYLLLGRLGLAWPRRLFALGMVLVCPVYIFYSRAFLMDSMELMFCAWFLFGFMRMMDRRKWYWFVLTAVAGAGAALVKSATLAIWLWPAAGYGAWLLWRDVRARRGWGPPLETVFWGLAGVTVPLGVLRWWILLTDPIKEAHAAAWMFTSRNLAAGNWGLTDLAARVSWKTWVILAERWREAVMPPWLLLTLLVVGGIFLPKVRKPVLGLAGVFFLAQLLFPWAYAFQDYYFYSCALFLSAAFAYLFFGLLDSPAPRWLCWLLLAVPVGAQLYTYQTGYYPQQAAKSDGGFSFTMALRDYLPRDSVIVVVGGDWSGVIPYYSQHKALMVRNGLENDAAYLDRAFADLIDEDVSALVLVGGQRGNQFVIQRAAAAFGLDVVPSVTHPLAEIYCSLRYRDRFKKELKAGAAYGDIINEPMPPIAEGPSRPYRVLPDTAHAEFPFVSPAPLRAYFGYGLGYMWVDGKKVIFAHPDCDLWIRAPRSATRIEWDFGMVADAYERAGGKTDGIELSVTGIGPGGATRVIFNRALDPVNRPADRGQQRETISYQPLPGEILQFSNRPRQGSAFDWTYWSRIEVK